MNPMVRSPLTIEHALLGFIYQKSTHGYEIHQQLGKINELGLVWQLKISQIYALLAKLEETSYLTSTLETQESYPPRKIFHLTQTGQDAFLNWVTSPVKQFRDMRLEFMAKLYFARQLSAETLLLLITCQQTICYTWQKKLQTQIKNSSENNSYQSLVYQFRLGQIESTLAWLTICQPKPDVIDQQ